MDSLGEALSLEQFMAGCEAVGGGGAHPHALPHLGVTVPLPRTLEITPVKDAVPPAPSSVPSDATTMSVLTPVKAERLQQPQQQQQQQGNNHPDHHHHRAHAPEHIIRLTPETKSLKTEGTRVSISASLLNLFRLNPFLIIYYRITNRKKTAFCWPSSTSLEP